MPLAQFHGNFEIDDLSLIYKQKLAQDGGFVLSGGLTATIPVNPYKPVLDGKKYIPQLQPFVGYLWQQDRMFIHGFSSVGAPTSSVLPALLFNDIGIGWNCQCGRGAITTVTSTFEVHVNAPLNHRDASDAERRRDSVDPTTGVHLQLGDTVWIGLGVGTSVTHPQLFKVEALGSVNWRF